MIEYGFERYSRSFGGCGRVGDGIRKGGEGSVLGIWVWGSRGSS